MQPVTRTVSPQHLEHPWYRWAGMIVLIVAPALAHGASITGAVVDSAGAPLYQVPVCLRDFDHEQRDCLKLRFSDRRGIYSFNGLKAGNRYSLSIFYDKSANARKFQEYTTYVWTPSQSVAITDKKDSIVLPAFQGTFGFSNFQRVIELSASDFPELTQVDLNAGAVFLKVAFDSVTSPDLPPETIFLGTVSNPDNLRLEASIPLAATGIDYQIFGANFSYDGRISLAE
jgi:hypothetical protein